jgi:hypothetical protein
MIHRLTITIFLLTSVCTNGQTNIPTNTKNKSFIDLGIQCAPISKGADIGLNFNWEEGFGKRLSLGLSTSVPMFYAGTNNSFGYGTTNPKIGYFLVGLIAEYKIIDSKKLNLYFTMNNGYSNILLGDGNHLSGSGHSLAIPHTLAANQYYSLQPGLHFALKDKRDFGFHFRVSYNLFYGASKFGTADSYNHFSVSIGAGGLFSKMFSRNGVHLPS